MSIPTYMRSLTYLSIIQIVKYEWNSVYWWHFCVRGLWGPAPPEGAVVLGNITFLCQTQQCPSKLSFAYFMKCCNFWSYAETISSLDIFVVKECVRLGLCSKLLARFRSVEHGRDGPAPAVLWNGQIAERTSSCSKRTLVSQVGPDSQIPRSIPIGWFDWRKGWHPAGLGALPFANEGLIRS